MVMVETVEQERKRLYDALERLHARLADAVMRHDLKMIQECNELIRHLRECIENLKEIERESDFLVVGEVWRGGG